MNGGELLARLLETAEREGTFDLLAARGGEEVYFPLPESLTEDHWLTRLMGLSAAAKVCGYLGMQKVTLPFGPDGGSRNRQHKRVRAAARAGLSVNEIVRETGLYARTVRRILKRERPGALSRHDDPRQLRLFEITKTEPHQEKEGKES